MVKSLKNIALILLVALYFVAANGMALELAAQWYSSGARTAVDLQSERAKELPLPSLTQRTYTPPTLPTILVSAGFVVSTIAYPSHQPLSFIWLDQTLPSYTAELFSSLANRAPPTA